MKTCLLAGGEPRSVRDLSRRLRLRGLDVQFVWENEQTKFPEQLPASVEVVVQLRDACTHVVSTHADELVRRARLAGRDVAYIITSRRAAKWEPMLDAAGYFITRDAEPSVSAPARDEMNDPVPPGFSPEQWQAVEKFAEKFPDDAEPTEQISTAPPPIEQLQPQQEQLQPEQEGPVMKKRKKNRQKFTQQEETEIKELLIAGERPLDIASVYECSDWMVYNVAKKYTLDTRALRRQRKELDRRIEQELDKEPASVKPAAVITPTHAPVITPTHAPVVSPAAPAAAPVATISQREYYRARWVVEGVNCGMLKVEEA